MFTTFLKFEIKNWLRAPMPWIFMLVFGLLTFGAIASDDLQIGGSYGNVWKNAPYVAGQWYATFSILSLLLVTAFLNSAAVRDFENNTAQIIFASPVGKAGYYFGHFFGALLIALIPMAGVSLGMWAGVACNGIFEWVPPERVGPFELAGHLNSYLMFVIPNMIFAGGILYAVATTTRSTMYAFIAAVALLVGYIIAGTFTRDLENEWLANLLDPFGVRAFNNVTKYWTVDDKNHLALSPFHPTMLLNRLLWMAVGVAVLVVGYFKFDFAEKKQGGKKAKSAPADDDAVALRQLGTLPKATPATGTSTTLAQLWSQLKTEFFGTVKSTPFILLTFIGLLNLYGNMRGATRSYGTTNLPVTYDMVDVVRGGFYLFTIAILAYFTGALVWKERTSKVNEIYDALPTKNWTSFAAKYLTVVGVLFLLNCAAIGMAMAGQAANGYFRFELGVYVQELLVLDLLNFACMAALFMLVQTLVPNMYLGFFVNIVLLAVNAFVWGTIDVSSNMVSFASAPSYTFSDFYGIAPYLSGLFWFKSYWLLFCLLLAIGTVCLWVRGKETGWLDRLKTARAEWKNYRLVGIGALVAWVVTAGFVFYNTKVLNENKGTNAQEKAQARYETTYKKYEGMAQPRIYDVKYDIQLFPEKRRVEANIQYWVRNKHTQPLDTLFLLRPSRMDFTLENNGRLTQIHDDAELFIRFYKIEPALAPGDSMRLNFTTVYEPKGFENELTKIEFAQNGTFFNNGDIAPTFGYHEGGELSDKNKRRDYHLPEKSRMPALDTANLAARSNQYLNIDADWVTVETKISTSGDQTAIAPGSLRRQWQEGGRNFFEYKLDHKAWNFYSFMSAKYEVARREWNGIQLEVYYHHEHPENVERMLKSMQKSLEYYTANFGPYYHKQCRIIEFPRHASFAQAFPGTMPYSEGIGFIENFQAEKDDIDMVFYVVAHEMGHQYWAHQECGAMMQGSEMTTETFAQYSALMVMEKEYGRDIMRKFLEYEMDRYLRGRSSEREKELPIGKCERQGYIHYQKGSVVMYYLKEMLGEAQVNTALRAFLERFKYKEPPYPTSAHVIEEFEKQTPDSLKYIIQDLFWDITLFENRMKEASVKDLGNGQWEVTIQTESRKLKADELGKEQEVPVNDWMEIGAFAKPEGDKKYGKTLHRQRVKITQRDNTFTFKVSEKPEKAGIDPFSLLVDREPKDNVKKM